MSSAPNRFPLLPTRRRLALTVLLAGVLTLLAWAWLYPPIAYPYRIEFVLDAYAPGFTQMYFDRGHGLSESDSVQQRLGIGPNKVSLPFPAGRILGVRFDALDRAGTARIGPLRLVSPTGKTIRLIGPNQIAPVQQIAGVHTEAGSLTVTTTPDADDPQLTINFDPPLDLPFTRLDRIYAARYWLLRCFLLCLLIGVIAENLWRNGATYAGAIATFARARPRAALALCAVVAAVLSSYPVVFFGRSFVSPSTTMLLYNSTPSVPGYSDAKQEDARGADVGAMLWQHYSYTVQQHRALAAGELPLWNRFVACGVTLLGQGQTMLGDPLQFLVVLTNGATWAFDLKFLLAKALFACGIGWCVWALTRDLAAAAILTLGSAFIAFFNYRLNHPSIFTMGYAPWILVAWLHLRDAGDRRQFRHALLLWYAANWMVITSGTVKEAYLLALTLNLTGAAIFFVARGPLATKLRAAAVLALAAVAFALTTAPLWRTFLAALATSYTNYDHPSLVQLPGQWFIGFFDDIFYREFMPSHSVHKPAANFLVLLGCLWAVTQPSRLFAARAPLVLAIAGGASLLLAFRFGPPSWSPDWVLRVPLLRNVVNLDTIFSCVGIVLLSVLAGWGLSAARQPLAAGRVWRHGAIMGVTVMLLFAAYFFIQPDNFAAGHVWPTGSQVTRESVLLYAAVILLPLAAWTLTLVASRRLRRGRLNAIGVIVALVALLMLLGRHGQHLRGIPTTYVAAPGPRADLQAPSPAVEVLRARTRTEPGRVIGLDRNLFAGFSSIYGLEFIFGANALENRWYRQFAEAAGLVTPAQWIFETPVSALPAWRPIADFLNVRYLATPGNRPFAADGFHPVAALDLKIFASDHPWPRAFFTAHLERYGTPADLVARIRSSNGEQPFAAVQDGETIPAAVREPVAQLLESDGSTPVVFARDYALKTNTTAFTIDAPQAGIAVLQETWLPDDFHVTVNGRDATYLRINHAFKGVILPAAGTYRISFNYWPAGLTASFIMSGAGLALILATLALVRALPSRLFPSP